MSGSVLWKRLPATLDHLPPQPAVTQQLLLDFFAQLKTFDLPSFNELALPRYRVTHDMVAPILSFDADAYWRDMKADRYGEHQPPDLPSYRWVTEDRPDYIKYVRSLRPFNSKLIFGAIAALLDPAGPWFDALASRAKDFAEWCQSPDCSIWAGTYDVSDIADNFANFFDMCFDRLSTEQRKDFLNGIEAMTRKLRDLIDLFKPHKYPRDSHVLRMTVTYASMCILLHVNGREEGTRGLRYWTDQMAAAFPGFAGDDGAWAQGAAYWKWKVSQMLTIAEPMRDLGFVDLLGKPFLQNTGYYKWYVQPPYSRTGAFGDHPNLRAEPLDMAMLRLLGAMLNRDDLIAYADYYEPKRGAEAQVNTGGVDLLALLLLLLTWDLPADKPSKVPAAQSRYLADEGIVASHIAIGDVDRDVTVLFRSSKSGSFGHAHADQNGFTAEAYGSPIFIDAGYYPTYHHPHMKGFTIQTLAHNALLINNQGQSIRNLNAVGKIEHYESDATHDYTIGECAAAYPCNPKLVRRHLWFQRSVEHPALVIVDHVILRQPGTVDFLLHSYEKPEWNAAQNHADFFGWRLWGDHARARVQFLSPSRWYWHQTDEFPYPADGRETGQAKQWHARATTADPTYEHWLVTAISFADTRTAGTEPGLAAFSLQKAGNSFEITNQKLGLRLQTDLDRLLAT